MIFVASPDADCKSKNIFPVSSLKFSFLAGTLKIEIPAFDDS
jgi:hypothetical protein